MLILLQLRPFLVTCLFLFAPQAAFAHGDAPSTCKNLYGASVTSLVIDAAGKRINVTKAKKPKFRVPLNGSYVVTATLKVADKSNAGNTEPGTTWFGHTAYGFGQGRCTDPVKPGQDLLQKFEVTLPGNANPKGATTDVEFYLDGEGQSFAWTVIWAGKAKK